MATFQNPTEGTVPAAELPAAAELPVVPVLDNGAVVLQEKKDPDAELEAGPGSKFDADRYSDDTYEYDLKNVDPNTPGWVPDLTWTAEEEKEIRKHFDYRILPFIIFQFIFLNLDRFNVSNALTGGLMQSIGATLDNINMGATLLLIGFCVFEIPSNMIIMKVGAHRWLPSLMIGWGLVSTFQAFITNVAGFYATRFLIGAFEAGWIPGVVLYFSFHYTRGELATRLAIFWGCNQVSAAISGILAYGILRMNGLAGLKGWQWLFLLEGAATVLVGIVVFFFLPDRPYNNTHLTERQRQIAVTRLIKDDPHKGGNPKAIVPLAEVWAALSDWNVYPNLIFAFLVQITTAGYGLYLPLIIQSFGFDALLSNLLTVPNQMFALAIGLASGFLADRYKTRWPIILFGMGGLILGYVLNLVVPASTSRAGAYVASIITVGFFLPWHAVNASWQAANVAPAGKRAIIFSMYIISVNIAGALGVWLYRDDDRPLFRRALSTSIAIVAVAFIIVVLRRFQLVYLNKLRDRKWSALSQDEKEEYSKGEARKKGDRSLNFRYTIGDWGEKTN
ncbi:major facilitator superfamily domain-containing protein [Hyaloraphidium curvatum]|nr:major facilitator superfamily domain-containing protein [Hyaloraphidium curvatum]